MGVPQAGPQFPGVMGAALGAHVGAQRQGTRLLAPLNTRPWPFIGYFTEAEVAKNTWFCRNPHFLGSTLAPEPETG